MVTFWGCDIETNVPLVVEEWKEAGSLADLKADVFRLDEVNSKDDAMYRSGEKKLLAPPPSLKSKSVVVQHPVSAASLPTSAPQQKLTVKEPFVSGQGRILLKVPVAAMFKY